MNDLPKMPMPARTLYGPNRTVDGHYFTADQMRAYAQAALNARAGGDAKDAERYRWLRDSAHPDNDAGFGIAATSHEMSGWGHWYIKHHSGEPLDAAIDDALASQAVGVKS